ncbi:MAG: rRNA pseudouridine synthase [Oscillospiraceae bacterium]|nr:rRNA pseudouridine synthase [Oscillospiraceae bacterium]
MERVQKLLSQYGVCSRREAERLILAGRVTVAGKPAELGQKAEPEQVRVDGRPLGASGERVYIMLNKPRGYVTTVKDEAGRRNVADLVASCGTRVYPVGRLDMASEGLLLMTNDGEVTNKLTHPRYGMTKVYHVRVEGEDPFAACSEMARGITYEGVEYSPAKASVLEREGSRALLEVTVAEGKNREVRKMCEACGLSVRRLVRVEEGKLSLGRLASGKWRYLTAEEIEYLKSL